MQNHGTHAEVQLKPFRKSTKEVFFHNFEYNFLALKVILVFRKIYIKPINIYVYIHVLLPCIFESITFFVKRTPQKHSHYLNNWLFTFVDGRFAHFYLVCAVVRYVPEVETQNWCLRFPAVIRLEIATVSFRCAKEFR